MASGLFDSDTVQVLSCEACGTTPEELSQASISLSQLIALHCLCLCLAVAMLDSPQSILERTITCQSFMCACINKKPVYQDNVTISVFASLCICITSGLLLIVFSLDSDTSSVA